MKKITLFLIATIALCHSSQAQSSVEFNAGLNFNQKIKNEQPFLVQDYEDRVSYRIGIGYNKQLKKRLFLKTGLRFATMGYAFSSSGLIYESDYLPDGTLPAVLDPSLPRSVRFTTDHYYMGIPLHLRYEFGKKPLKVYAEGGMAANVYLVTRSAAKTNLDDAPHVEHRRASSFVTPVVISQSLAVGLQQNIKNRYQIFAQTGISGTMNSLENGGGFRFWGVGVEVGLRRFLSKAD